MWKSLLTLCIASVLGASPAYAYVVLGLSLDPEGEAVCGTTDVASTPFTVTSVGGSENQCARTAAFAEDTLENLRPAIAGRKCWPIHKVSSLPPRYDEDVPDRDRFVATDTYVLRSTTA